MGRTLFLPSSFKMLAAVGAAFLVWGLLLAYASSPAQADTIDVTSTDDVVKNDDGKCTLREAITSANTNMASGGATGECAAGSSGTTDVINIGTSAVPVTGTVNLTGLLTDLSSNLAIAGPGADKFTVRRDTGGDYGIFHVTSGSVVSISGITISNGNAATSFGGGIYNEGGILTITDSTISGNSSSGFGSANTSFGGGIYNGGGTLTITGSTISGNTAEFGAGIFSNGRASIISPSVPTTTITNSTISGNTTPFGAGAGGGLYNFNGLTVIEHSTITNNTGSSGGGSGVASEGDQVTRTEVLSSIISANSNTDVDHVARGGSTTNTFVSKGYNLIGDGNATGAFNQTGDTTGVSDPKLGDLADNGGPTMTHALLTDSPAIDKGPPSTACPPPSTDQRGVSRPQGSACDIGAYEVEVEVVDTTPPTVTTTIPKDGATDVSRTTTVKANFSEEVQNVSPETFILERKIAVKKAPAKFVRVDATVSPSIDGLSAELTPVQDLPKGEYRATITTDVTDMADNALDQDSVQGGNQPKVWTFKVAKLP